MNLPTDRAREDEVHAAEDDVRRAYAELGDEPVPPDVDARVLAAAHTAVRPVRARPRWLVPASLAATVVLAVGVALDVLREARVESAGESAPSSAGADAQVEAPAPSADSASAPASAAASDIARESTTPVAPARSYERAPAAVADRALADAVADTHDATVPPPPAPRAERRAEPAAAAPPPLAPEAWLLRIEALRRDGRTAEADAEYARFLLAYPDYRAPDAPR
jgi:hypothetical protein